MHSICISKRQIKIFSRVVMVLRTTFESVLELQAGNVAVSCVSGLLEKRCIRVKLQRKRRRMVIGQKRKGIQPQKKMSKYCLSRN